MAIALGDIIKASIAERKRNAHEEGSLLEADSDDDDLEEEPEMEPWVNIQRSTFTNWARDKLSHMEIHVEDIRKDFRNGIKLCRLAEVLIGKPIGRIVGLNKKRLNHYEASGNLALALDAFKKDQVRLVNIGAEDIRGGNLKLILGMMWSLIRRYQLGSSRLPPKTLMMRWMNAVLHPHLTLTNFSTDLNDGRALHGVLEYCRPGLAPEWHQLNPHDQVENCRKGMSLAQEEFGIPEVLSPEHFASGDLDELSGMTYFSYFMTKGAPGYETTLAWTRQTVHPTPVEDFSTSWNDGVIASSLAHALGGHVPGYPDVDKNHKKACSHAIQVSSQSLGVPSIVTAGDMSNPGVDHIALMAYAAWHRALVPSYAALPGLSLLHNALHPSSNGTASEPGQISPPSSRSPSPPSSRSPSPPPVPPHPPPVPEVSSPSQEHVVYSRTCCVNACCTLKVDTSKLGVGKVEGQSHSPSKQIASLPVERVDSHTHHLLFTPSQAGHWSVDIQVDGAVVKGSPFAVQVYDSSLAQIIREDPSSLAVGSLYSFKVDVSDVGLSDVDVAVSCGGRSVPSKVEGEGRAQYEVTFAPESPGRHDVSVFVGGNEVPGSPFGLDVVEGPRATSEETLRSKEEEGLGSAPEARALEALGAVGEVRGDGIRSAVVGKAAIFEVDPPEEGDVHCIVTDAQGSSLEVDQENKPGGNVVQCSYVPQNEGLHKVEVLNGGRALPGSPFSVEVWKPDLRVRNMANKAIVHQEFSFFVDASEMGKGAMEIDSDMRLQRYDPVPGRRKCFQVTCIPERLGRHSVIVRFNKKAMADSPYQVEVVRK